MKSVGVIVSLAGVVLLTGQVNPTRLNQGWAEDEDEADPIQFFSLHWAQMDLDDSTKMEMLCLLQQQRKQPVEAARNAILLFINLGCIEVFI